MNPNPYKSPELLGSRPGRGQLILQALWRIATTVVIPSICAGCVVWLIVGYILVVDNSAKEGMGTAPRKLSIVGHMVFMTYGVIVGAVVGATILIGGRRVPKSHLAYLLLPFISGLGGVMLAVILLCVMSESIFYLIPDELARELVDEDFRE